LTVIVFDVSSSFGYFRKSFTTTNSLSFNLIPRSAVEGLIGAIVGMSSEEYPDILKDAKIAVQILSEVRKINFKEKTIHPDWLATIPRYLINMPIPKVPSFSVPASIELLIHPKYRIFFDGGTINKKLYDMLKSKKSHYTPYLGSSSMICSAKIVGNFEYAKSNESEYKVSSVISFFDEIPKITLNNDSKFAIEEGLPIHIDKDRMPYGTYNVVYSPNMGKIQITKDEIYSIKMGKETTNVKFLPTPITS
jgi:CRISPR-associated protein Cas5h